MVHLRLFFGCVLHDLQLTSEIGRAARSWCGEGDFLDVGGRNVVDVLELGFEVGGQQARGRMAEGIGYEELVFLGTSLGGSFQVAG